jgi:hypothetical protein
MRIKLVILATFLTLLVGCASTSVYVLDQSELVRVKKGEQINAMWDSWCLSDRAVQRVMDAKIKGVNLK